MTDTHVSAATEHTLMPCPLCDKAMMFRKALWPSDGNIDAVIHAEPTTCGMVEFSDGTADESIIAKWNDRPRDAAQAGRKPDAWQLFDKGRWLLLPADWDESENIPGRTYRPLYAAHLPAAPERGSPEWFCHWLKGYLGAITGRDELDAFEANSIRSELARVFPPAPAAPVEEAGYDEPQGYAASLKQMALGLKDGTIESLSDIDEMELYGAADLIERQRERILALTAHQSCSAGTTHDLSCAADFLDDIEVDGNGKCEWTAVANAQTHIRAALRCWRPDDLPQEALKPDLEVAARFLLDRLDEFDPGEDEPEREYHGHVAPAIARLRSALSRPHGGGAA